MIETDLPSPSIGGKGHHLRRIAAMAINYVAIYASNYASGRHPQATMLKTFFTACATALNALVPIAATGVFTPSAKTYSIATGVTAGPALAITGTGAVTYASGTPSKCTVNVNTGAITPLVTGTSVITATIEADGDYLAGTATYTATVTA